MATPGQSIRQMCLDCLGEVSGHSAYDCCSTICALYPSHPFRGKPKPIKYREMHVGGDRIVNPVPKWEVKKEEAAHKKTRKQRPSKRMIAAMCRQCHVETRDDCCHDACALHKFTPFQAGGQPKRRLTGTRLEAARASAARMHRKTA